MVNVLLLTNFYIASPRVFGYYPLPADGTCRANPRSVSCWILVGPWGQHSPSARLIFTKSE
jgi:hypothetical protein